MKHKVFLGAILAVVVTTSSVPFNTYSDGIVYADSQQEELDLSSSWRKLRVKTACIQLSVLQARVNPNVTLPQLPQLNSIQSTIKNTMKDWENEISPCFMYLDVKSKSFINKFDSYYPQLKTAVEKNDRKEVLNRLDSLKAQVTMNKSKIQNTINEVQPALSEINIKIPKLNRIVVEGQKLLAGPTGKVSILNVEMKNIQNAMDKNLEAIAMIPGALDGQGWEILKLVSSLVKDSMDPVKQATIAAYNKGKEIEKSIEKQQQQVQTAAEEKAKQENRSLTEAEQQDLTNKKDAIRKKIEEDNKDAIVAARDAELQKFDFKKMIEVDKISNAFGKISILSAEQRKNLNDLVKHNNKLYELTKNLNVAELQYTQMLEMQNTLDKYADQVTEVGQLLIRYKKDWEQIESCIEKMKTNPSSTHLKRLKDLRDQLEEQVNTSI